jgi:hypothetical protein
LHSMSSRRGHRRLVKGLAVASEKAIKRLHGANHAESFGI